MIAQAAIDPEPGRMPTASHLPLSQTLVVGLGNALEFYDFLIFSFFAIQIGHTFFPASQTSHGLLYSLATFGIGFITRPLGGIVIGAYGDRAGRKPAMVLSFGLMGVAILGLALTPSFAQIGIAAPLLLLSWRLIQGFALGGEVGPSTALLIEAAPPNQRGLYVSIQNSTQGLAILTAGIFGYMLSSLLTPASLESWGWRIAFLLGAAVVPVGLYVRRNLPETLHDSNEHEGLAERPRVPVGVILPSLLMLGAATTATYVLGYMNTYAQDTLKLVTHLAFGATILNGIGYLLAAPAGGILADRIGSKTVMLCALGTLLILVVPSYLMLEHLRTAAALYTATGILSIAGQVFSVSIMITITQALPKAVRSGALATIYAVAIAVFGGSAQFIVKWLVGATGNPIAPAWYLSGMLVVGGCAMLAFRPRSCERRVGG